MTVKNWCLFLDKGIYFDSDCFVVDDGEIDTSES